MNQHKARLIKIVVMDIDDERRTLLVDLFQNKRAEQMDLGQESSKEIDIASRQFTYVVFEAKSQQEALKLFKTIHPDLILITYNNECNDGQYLCSVIRKEEIERRTGIVFIGSSDNLDEMSPVECLKSGADDFITKEATPREIKARVNAVLRLKFLADELRAANHRLEILSLTDELTGLDNMRAFNSKYSSLLDQCRNGVSGLGVLMIDLDHFKEINDRCNHLVGSYIIREVGRLIRLSGIFPASASKARYGGDEYIISFLSESYEKAMEKCEKLRKIIASSHFTKDNHEITITCSSGLCWVEDLYTGSDDEPIKAADIMLYKSKQYGRNQVNGMIMKPNQVFSSGNSKGNIFDFEEKEEANIAVINNLKLYK